MSAAVCSSSLLLSFGRRKLDRDRPVDHSHGIRLDPHADFGPQHSSGLERNLPAMQRAYYRRSADDAIAHRPAAMRTVVVDRSEAIAQVEDRDFMVADPHTATFAQRDVGRLGNPNPVHCRTL